MHQMEREWDRVIWKERDSESDRKRERDENKKDKKKKKPKRKSSITIEAYEEYINVFYDKHAGSLFPFTEVHY